MHNLNLSKSWQALHAGDIIEIIAPASPCLKTEAPLAQIQEYLTSWGLVPRIPTNIFGKDLLCANTDELRFEFLKNALVNSESKAIWCLRGGYGSARLIPKLAALGLTNITPKLFIGMSDITALHLFLQQAFGWATLHGPSARQVTDNDVDAANIQELKKIIFGQQQKLYYDNLTFLNDKNLGDQELHTSIIGGNLCLIQNSIGTLWQINADNKILFLEETSERGYRIDRMLQHLEQAHVFDGILAVILGDFSGGKEPDGSSLVEPVLKRFAENCNFPVLRCPGVGHERFNRPLPLGTKAILAMNGTNPTLTVDAGFIHV